MKPLLVLFTLSLLAFIILRLVHGKYEWALAARIGMSGMLLFTALGHFLFTEGMTLMLPDFLPLKKEIVYFTGVLEIAAAVGLHFAYWRPLTACLLLLFFVLVLPANIHAAIHHVNYQKASFDGPSTVYLWFRIPLQLLFIAWVYLSALRVQ